jgi:hypothetical protein
VVLILQTTRCCRQATSMSRRYLTLQDLIKLFQCVSQDQHSDVTDAFTAKADNSRRMQEGRGLKRVKYAPRGSNWR